jgi:hypothetical protein
MLNAELGFLRVSLVNHPKIKKKWRPWSIATDVADCLLFPKANLPPDQNIGEKIL